MSKRSHLELEDEPFSLTGDDAEITSSYDDVVSNTGVLLNLFRMIIARYSRHRRIRKEHFTPILHRYNIKGNINQWVKLLQENLEDLFGMTLHVIGNEIVVTNNLELSSLEVLALLFDEETVHLQRSGNNLADPLHLMPHHRRLAVAVNTVESILGGILVLIVCIIVVHENRIREVDLLEALKEFGFSKNLSTLVANLNRNTQDILGELVRRDYLSKSVSQTGDQLNQVDYCLGKRALREFQPEVIVDFMSGMFEQGEMHQKCMKTVQRCFPEANITVDSANNES